LGRREGGIIVIDGSWVYVKDGREGKRKRRGEGGEDRLLLKIEPRTQKVGLYF
jgi:hypothetical protein